mmetsp:Transcript_51152/g.143080  ORF Transcript_51152/g.143080 Transcript_51152/m.143080 type:complete len:243 (+) Transcript_51152:609-1337(+)
MKHLQETRPPHVLGPCARRARGSNLGAGGIQLRIDLDEAVLGLLQVLDQLHCGENLVDEVMRECELRRNGHVDGALDEGWDLTQLGPVLAQGLVQRLDDVKRFLSIRVAVGQKPQSCCSAFQRGERRDASIDRVGCHRDHAHGSLVDVREYICDFVQGLVDGPQLVHDLVEVWVVQLVAARQSEGCQPALPNRQRNLRTHLHKGQAKAAATGRHRGGERGDRHDKCKHRHQAAGRTARGAGA